MNTEQLNWLTLLRLSEQDIARQSLEDKAQRIRDLESEVRYLKDLLGNVMRTPQLQPAPKRHQTAPKRWSVH